MLIVVGDESEQQAVWKKMFVVINGSEDSCNGHSH